LRIDTMPLEQLEAELTESAGQLAAAECRFLLAIAAYGRREGWREWGCRTCSFWLSWRCGIDLRTAQERLRVAHALALFPRVREEFAAGRLSYSKVRALTRMAGRDTEAELVEMARRATAAHMESIARGYRRVERSAERRDPSPRTRPGESSRRMSRPRSSTATSPRATANAASSSTRRPRSPSGAASGSTSAGR
jgi:hypothetical protein